MKFCGRRTNNSDDGNGSTWEVWAETPDGALAVTGTIQTETIANKDLEQNVFEDEKEIFG